MFVWKDVIIDELVFINIKHNIIANKEIPVKKEKKRIDDICEQFFSYKDDFIEDCKNTSYYRIIYKDQKPLVIIPSTDIKLPREFNRARSFNKPNNLIKETSIIRKYRANTTKATYIFLRIPYSVNEYSGVYEEPYYDIDLVFAWICDYEKRSSLLKRLKVEISSQKHRDFYTINPNSFDLIVNHIKGNITSSDESESQTIPQKNNENMLDLNNQTNSFVKSSLEKMQLSGSVTPDIVSRNVKAVKRNISIVEYLKQLYESTCQVCGQKVDVGNNQFLSEVHHIKPLGQHNGPDLLENMLVLCPNHHLMFDRGAVSVDIVSKRIRHVNPTSELNHRKLILKHKINSDYLEYHNNHIFILKNSKAAQQSSLVKHDFNRITYGNNVVLIDLQANEEFEIELEKEYNREFMTGLQQVLLNHSVSDTVRHNGFTYKILRVL